MRGDIVLCKATDYGNGGWSDKIIAWATKGPWVHVEIDLGNGTYVGAHLNGISQVDASSYTATQSISPTATTEDIDSAISWVERQIGKQYGWIDILSAGLKFLNFPWFIGQPGHYDCSDFATRYLLIARDTKIIPRLGELADEPHLVSPNDLARAGGVL